MRLSKELLIASASVNYRADSAYDYTKWNVGNGIIYNNGATDVDKYFAPHFDVMRPMEESTAFASMVSYGYNLSTTQAYIFSIENSTAASATRRIHLWSVNRKTMAKSWNGYITLTLATSTAHTCRDFKIDVKNESTGTVGVVGTAVTGSGTQFVTNSVAIGARIGFGSTNPALITQWFRVSAIASDTGITIGTSVPSTVTAGTAYVMQEFRPIYVATNATTTNGGIHYAKGVSIEDFVGGSGTTIALAVATDNQKAVYWIKDAATQTNIVAAGCAIDEATATPLSLDTYVLDLVSAGNYKVYKYNLRAALTVASGASVSAFVLATGNQAITGTGSQAANLTLATAGHGTGSGVKSLYFMSTTRFMRAATANITSANTTWKSDEIAEIPPGSTNSYAASSNITTVAYLANLDTFVIGTLAASQYITQYVASGQQFQGLFSRNLYNLDQTLKDNGLPSMYSSQGLTATFCDFGYNGVIITKQSTASSQNQIYIMTFGADATYAALTATKGRLISPEISTTNALKYYRIFANMVMYQGSTALGMPSEAFRIYARTANIQVDDTTGWTLITDSKTIAGFAGAASIQFAIEFRTIGAIGIPARFLGLNLEYEDNTSDSHYALSVEKSSITTKIIAWWFDTAFGTTVPTLRVNLYDAVTGGLLLTDTTTASANGVWEKTTDGTTWGAYDTADRGNNTTWIRYTPTSLADNVLVEAYIQQA